MFEAHGALFGVVGGVSSPRRFVARSGIVVTRGEGAPPTFTKTRTEVRAHTKALPCC
jgi:hypothetical protein